MASNEFGYNNDQLGNALAAMMGVGANTGSFGGQPAPMVSQVSAAPPMQQQVPPQLQQPQQTLPGTGYPAPGGSQGSLPGGGGYFTNPGGGGGTTGNVNDQGLQQFLLGVMGLPPQLVQQLMGMSGHTFAGPPQAGGGAGGPDYTDTMSQYTGVPNPPANQFGFGTGNGVPGGDVLAYMASVGMPIPPFLQQIFAQQGGVGRTDYGVSSQKLGGAPIPSLQSLNRAGPDATEFLAGLYETLLGIPFDRIVESAAAPFSGLARPAPPRRRV